MAKQRNNKNKDENKKTVGSRQSAVIRSDDTPVALAPNLDDLDPRIIAIAEKIAREYQPEKIILFGSHAWGTPGPESDVDLFVVKETGTPPLDRMREVSNILWGSGVATDVLVYTSVELDHSIHQRRNLFIEDIVTNGRLLYDTNAVR